MCLGPTARICLQSITINDDEDFYDTWEVYIGALDREIHALITYPNFSTIANAFKNLSPQRLLMLHPIPQSHTPDIRISTRWIANRFLQIGLRYAPERCFNVYQYFSYESPPSLAAEWLFKAYGQYWLQSGGRFMADRLPAHDPRSLPQLIFHIDRFKADDRCYFTSPATLVDQVVDCHTKEFLPNTFGKYFIPYGSNHASFDALLFMSADTMVLFAITLEKIYHIQPQGLKDLCLHFAKLIRNIHIIYVIPAARRQDYGLLPVNPKPGEIRAPTQQIIIRQFRLVLPDYKIYQVAFPGGSVHAGESH